MKQKTKITISAILVITWMVVIFCFSAVPADESNKQSLNIVNKAIEKFKAKSGIEINQEVNQKIKVGQANQNGAKSNEQQKQIQNKVDSSSQQKQIENKNLQSNNTVSNQSKQKLVFELNKLLRKFAHASVYFILYMLVLNLVYQIKREYKFAYCMISIAVCFVYACTDEFHQLFVDGRAGLFSDVIIDTIGATISCIVVEIIYKIITLICQKDKILLNKKEKINTKR